MSSATATQNLKWSTEKRKVSDLIPYAKNPRRLTAEEKEHLTASLQKFDLVEIPAINQDNTILAGHQRLKIMDLLGRGQEEIDVRVPSRMLDKEEVREYVVRSNRNTGSWDWDLLQENFLPGELLSWGFSDKELFGKFRGKTKNDDAAPALVAGQPKSRIGDVYELGPHRVMCGDSTSRVDVEKLMGDERADLVFTDPPYNVNYSGDGEKTSRAIENDNMSPEAFREFLANAFLSYAFASKPEASLYCCYASKTHREFEDSLNAAGFEVINQIIWVKLVASFGWGHYRWKHEPILFCRQKGQKTDFYGDRKQYTTWEEEKSDEELLAMFKDMIRKEEDGGSTVWRFSREGNYVHPTQKPVELVSRAILNSSKRGGGSIGPFSRVRVHPYRMRKDRALLLRHGARPGIHGRDRQAVRPVLQRQWETLPCG